MARRRTVAERREEVTAWRQSGESMARYAATRGYAATSLCTWAETDGAASNQGPFGDLGTGRDAVARIKLSELGPGMAPD